jgi:hypothetical protein
VVTDPHCAENIATIAEKAMGYAMLFPVAPTAQERGARKGKAFSHQSAS